MNWLENSHRIIALLVSTLWLVGFAILVVRPKDKKAGWIPVGMLALFVIGLGVDLFFVQRDLGGTQKIWSRGWIGPRDQDGAITIGILEDTLGLTAAIFSSLLALFLSANRWIAQREQAPERVYSGLLMSVAGISVAWMALTPWLSLLGISLTALGGFVMLGAKSEADLIEIFGTERTVGFVLSFAGSAVLAGGRGALALDKGFTLSSSSVPHGFDVMGGVLFLLGLFVQMQAIPFLSWVIRSPQVSSATSLIVAQIFPALATLGLAIRFEPELRGLGIFPIFQWVGLVSALLAALCGLAQKDWKTALPLWLSASLSFIFTALCSSGPTVAFPLFIGTAMSAAAVVILASAREDGVFSTKTRSWFRPFLGIAAANAVGLVGFVSSGAMAWMFNSVAQEPVMLSAFAFTLLMTELLFWKALFSIWTIAEPKNEMGGRNSILTLASAALLLVLSLGLIWTGCACGGVIPHDPDRLFVSWLGLIFSSTGSGSEWGDESGLVLGQSVLWSTVAIAGGFGFWLFARGENLLDQFLGRAPKLKTFLASGYSSGRIGGALVNAIRTAGEFTEHWVSDKLSGQWIPKSVETSLRHLSGWLDRADTGIHEGEASLLRQLTQVPAKAVQLVQNGDLQWYLVFGIGMMIALLVHFIRA